MKEQRVRPGQAVSLKDWDSLPPDKSDAFKEKVKAETAALGLRLAALQERLYASRTHAVLVVLQGLDTSGKDGAVRNVFAPINPLGLRVAAFKAPTQPELDHDYLWRVHAQAPAKGEIVVFNRSHYEEVLVVRVQGLAPKAVWERRYRHINEFERLLSDEGTLILKFFLHISKEEQKERLTKRLQTPEKHWKWDGGDLRDRARWDDYQEAYEAALSQCNSAEAPWHIVPADKKWWRDHVITRAMVEALEALKLEYPKPKEDLSKVVVK